MDSKTLKFSYPEHQENVLKLFYNLYEKNKLVDVTLACLEGSIKTHKIILSTCSPFFQKVLEENPCKHPVLILRGTSLKDLKIILDFIYTGSLQIHENKVESISRIAEELNITALKECLDTKYAKDKKRIKRSSETVYDNSSKIKKVEEVISDDSTPLHGRDTRFKGKKRVEVHHDRIWFPKATVPAKSKTNVAKNNLDQNESTKTKGKNSNIYFSRFVLFKLYRC